jgi:hypothetical protein
MYQAFNIELTRILRYMIGYAHGYIEGYVSPDINFPLYHIDTNLNNPLLLEHGLEHKFDLLTEELLTSLQSNQEEFSKWQQATIKLLSEQMCTLFEEHYDENYKWQLTNDQKALLQTYYRANGVLIDCLNLPDTCISRNVRKEIKDTLFLPIAEIQKRHND